jgi:hypothetical protein
MERNANHARLMAFAAVVVSYAALLVKNYKALMK